MLGAGFRRRVSLTLVISPDSFYLIWIWRSPKLPEFDFKEICFLLRFLSPYENKNIRKKYFLNVFTLLGPSGRDKNALCFLFYNLSSEKKCSIFCLFLGKSCVFFLKFSFFDFYKFFFKILKKSSTHFLVFLIYQAHKLEQSWLVYFLPQNVLLKIFVKI